MHERFSVSSDSLIEDRPDEGLGDILAGVQDRLGEVEDLLAASARAPDLPLLEAVLTSILAGPAKRLRPALVLLICDLFGMRGEGPVKLAAGTEVLHSATLVHDDIVDSAVARRGKPAVHAAWSQKVAVLSGDFLFASAADLVAQLDRPRIVRLFADTIQQMSRSEFLAPAYGGDPQAARGQYLAKIGGKTASLMALSCDAAADLAGADAAQCQAAHEYGWSLGIAFQIVDDILDVSGQSYETGKPVGSDLRQGQLTLPVILYLSGGTAEDSVVRRVLDGRASGDEDVAQALRLLRESGAIAEARRVAVSYAQRSWRALDGLPAGPSLEALRDLVVYATERSR